MSFSLILRWEEAGQVDLIETTLGRAINLLVLLVITQRPASRS